MAFATGMIGTTWALKRYQGEVQTYCPFENFSWPLDSSEQFSTAGRTVKTGLVGILGDNHETNSFQLQLLYRPGLGLQLCFNHRVLLIDMVSVDLFVFAAGLSEVNIKGMPAELQSRFCCLLFLQLSLNDVHQRRTLFLKSFGRDMEKLPISSILYSALWQTFLSRQCY